MKKLLRAWPKILISVVVLLLIAELVARFILGLGHLPVYIVDSEYEYIYAPNQEVYRFGNRVKTNSLSMRSEELSENDDLRILKFGDSVINGGAHVDQDSLASSLLEKKLSAQFNKQIRVLNISAQSWGPDNSFAYLKKHGNFDSKIFVLVVSSHDYNDNMHFREVVGVHPTWPNQQPLTAFTDGFNRYFWPGVKGFLGMAEDEYAYLKGFDDSKQNSGLQDFVDYTNENGIKLIVYLHAEQSEINAGKYERNGERILSFFATNNINVIEGIKLLKDPNAYRDNIHLNELGHRRLNEALFPYLQEECTGVLQH